MTDEETRWTPKRRMVAFREGGQWYGIDAFRVQEVFDAQTLVPFPLAPGPVAGLSYARGSVVVVVGFAALTGKADRLVPAFPAIRLAGSGSGIALGLTRQPEMVTVDEGEAASVLSRHELDPIAKGIVRFQGENLIVLSASKILRGLAKEVSAIRALPARKAQGTEVEPVHCVEASR